mgnify:CR=1 FL=1
MCNACIMEGVKQSMLSRRNLLSGAAAVTAGAVASGLLSARPALAGAHGRVVDLTHAWDGSFPTFDGQPGILYEPAVRFEDSGYQLYKLTIFEHSGTHMDVPLHFTADGMAVDALDPQKLVCPLCVIDITAKAAEDANAMVEPADIEAWVSANGSIPAGACVAMHSGWAARVGDAGYRNTPDGAFAFPGFSKAATDMLAGLDVAAIGDGEEVVGCLGDGTGAVADHAVYRCGGYGAGFGEGRGHGTEFFNAKTRRPDGRNGKGRRGFSLRPLGRSLRLRVRNMDLNFRRGGGRGRRRCSRGRRRRRPPRRGG